MRFACPRPSPGPRPSARPRHASVAGGAPRRALHRLAWLGALAGLLACDDAGNARFSWRASIEQVHVWHAAPGSRLQLEQQGRPVAEGIADEQGSYIFRKVAPGAEYRVRTGEEYTPALRVSSMAESAPPRSFYENQRLQPGYQYLEMRDGTTLSTYVTLPGPVELGPYPTVVNYSGYEPSRPGAPLDGMSLFCDELPILCDAPHAETSLLAGLMGYATVNVNIRGTGCSGGAYDYFETLQRLDGYDVIEIVAAQPWVLHGQVGMVGLSFPGISQLFVARERPPGLAAITPMSVIGDTMTTLMPGGILNDGFALLWVEKVLDRARPYGQGWERARVEEGDTVCEENQLLHSQRVDNVAQARQMPYVVPEVTEPLNPERWVHEIAVPVLLAGTWHDEQTGPFFATLPPRFDAAPDVRVLVQNGVHIDPYAPWVLQEWKYFLDLFVARVPPQIPQAVRDLAPLLFREMFDAPLTLPPERFPTGLSHEEALRAWRAEAPVRVGFESGAGPHAGSPSVAFERSYSAWPPATQVARRWYLAQGGGLDDAPSEGTGTASAFWHDAAAGARGILGSGSVWARAPDYDWRAPDEGRSVVFESAPLTEDIVMAGTGRADLFVRSTASEADLEVNLSEVRPDGQEMYVQSGWLRASKRKLGPDSTPLYPAPTYLEEDAQPLVPGVWTLVHVPIARFAHAFRQGSRIRIAIDTPGDSRSDWRFELAPVPDDTRIAIAHDVVRPSSVSLPVLAGERAETPLPACTLRGQPCREAPTLDNHEVSAE